MRAILAAYLFLTLSVSFVPMLFSPTLSYAKDTTISTAPYNVVLFYDDYPTRGDPEFQVTSKIAKPLVAHVDQYGAPTDWMFDSFIFYNYWLDWGNKPTQSYIDAWINYLFDGAQVANLDAAVAETKVSLNQPAYEMNVFLTIPVPFDSVNASVVINNIDKLLHRWSTYSPRNLRLEGLYWGFTENLLDVPGLESIVPKVGEYVHSKAYKLLMIPYRKATVEKLHALGFDYVIMQPNYMQDQSGNLNDFAMTNYAITAGYVDGVEMEMPRGVIRCCNGDWRSNLQTYLKQGFAYQWYRNTITAYYHGVAISEMATTPSDRAEYEAIYAYIKAVRLQLPFEGMQLRYVSQTTPFLNRNEFAVQMSTIFTFNYVSSAFRRMTVSAAGRITENGTQQAVNLTEADQLPNNEDTLLILRNINQSNLMIHAGKSESVILRIPGIKVNVTRQWALHDQSVLRTSLTPSGSLPTYRYLSSLKNIQAVGGQLDLDIYASYERYTQLLVHAEVWATQNGLTNLIETVELQKANVQFDAYQPTQAKCVIATAAYGSEMAAPVQFLRDYRDQEVMATHLGRTFQTAFDAWYYSWAPTIAQAEVQNNLLRATIRLAVIPMLGALIVSSEAFRILLPLNSEAAILAAGIIASTLLGTMYLTPLIFTLIRVTDRRISRRCITLVGSVGVCLTLLTTLPHGTTGLMENIIGLMVVETILLVPTLLVRGLVFSEPLRTLG
jgi:hypothetical protein